MSTQHILQTVIELSVIFIMLWGFAYEDKVIKFEQNIKRIVVGNYRRYKRLRRQGKQCVTQQKI